MKEYTTDAANDRPDEGTTVTKQVPALGGGTETETTKITHVTPDVVIIDHMGDNVYSHAEFEASDWEVEG